MEWISSGWVVAFALLMGAKGYLALGIYVWKRRRVPAARALLLSLIAIFIWTTAYALEMTTETARAGAIWSTVKYAGIVLLPPSLLAFAVEYTGRGRGLTRRTALLLSIEPLLVMTLLLVPGTHDLLLVYDDAHRAQQDSSWWVPKAGPLFWPHAVYSYVVLFSALALLATRLIRIARPYRRPAAIVIAASILPTVGNILYNTDQTTVDLTPFLFTLLAVVLTWGFFTMGLIDLVPVARSRVIEQMADAVLVLDAYHRVVDTNPAASGLLGVRRRHLIGQHAEEFMPFLAHLLAENRGGAATHVEIGVTGTDLGRDDEQPVQLDVQLAPLTDRQGLEAGRLMVLRDVTERTHTERRLRELLEAETHVAAVLQTSLRPARLPAVPRVRLAARSLPAGHGGQVSGDFYDVHQALGGDWAFVLGDVSGKGVHAAVITSMARYTTRTLSAQGWSPKQVIEQLNQALLAEIGADRFCTVAYCRIAEADPGPDGSPRPGVRVTVALGGHPSPLVRRCDGRIEAIGRSGTALGIVSLVEIEEVTIDLAPGEVLVAYTDGVTEARRDGDEFGEERLAWTMASTAAGLRGRSGAASAQLLADAVADRIVDTVTAYSVHRDDIAVLVMAVV